MTSKTMAAAPLAADKINVTFGGLNALTDVSFELEEHRITGLIGPNGAGKSTLVNTLSGLQPPTSGRVLLHGEQPARWSLGIAARSGVTRSFQASKVFFEMTVLENLTLGDMRGDALIRGEELIDLVGLRHRQDELAKNLSFGELRRLGVGIALVLRPSVLLLDEPGAGLAGDDLDQLSTVIKRVRDTGATVLLVDHNMRFLMNTVDHVLVLVGGQLICDGTPLQIQENELVREAYLGKRDNA